MQKAKHTNWDTLLHEINHETGFINLSESNRVIFQALGTIAIDNSNMQFSYENVRLASYILVQDEKIVCKSIKVLRQNTKNCGLSKRITLEINGINCLPSNCKAVFICPTCDEEYIVDLIPARCLSRKTSLCKKCQKKILHKTPSYNKNYENAMIAKYGCTRPIQHADILNKMKNTMLSKHGVPYAMQSDIVKQKHADNMERKYGIRNWFQNKNPRTEGWISTSNISLIEKKFVDDLIAALYTIDIKIYSYKTRQYVRNCEGIIIMPDVYIPQAKLIIEFYGDYWHANPKIYKDISKLFLGCTAAEVHNNDAIRIKTLLDNLEEGHICEVIWESDYKKQPNNVIEKCVKLIIERINNANTKT